MHGSYQHNQIDDRQVYISCYFAKSIPIILHIGKWYLTLIQTENGLVEAVAVLISKMPRLRPSLADEKLGMTYSFKPEFSKVCKVRVHVFMPYKCSMSRYVNIQLRHFECFYHWTHNGMLVCLSRLGTNGAIKLLN